MFHALVFQLQPHALPAPLYSSLRVCSAIAFARILLCFGHTCHTDVAYAPPAVRMQAHDMCFRCSGTPGWGLSKQACNDMLYNLANRLCDSYFPISGLDFFKNSFDLGFCKGTVTTMATGLWFGQEPKGLDCTGKYLQYVTNSPILAGLPADSCANTAPGKAAC